MTRIQWTAIIIGLLIFFCFFAVYKPPFEPNAHLDENLRVVITNPLEITLTPDNLNQEIPVSYTVENKGETNYQTSKHFIRVVLGRNVDTPGFILDEYQSSLPPKGSFTKEFLWKPDHVPAGGGSFSLFIYLYQEDYSYYPRLLAYGAIPVSFPVIPAPADTQ